MISAKIVVVLLLVSGCQGRICQKKSFTEDFNACARANTSIPKSRENFSGDFDNDYEYFMPKIKEFIMSGIAYSNKLFTNPVDKETKEAIDDTFLKADHHAINKLLKKYDKIIKDSSNYKPNSKSYDCGIQENLIDSDDYFSYQDTMDQYHLEPHRADESESLEDSDEFHFIEPMVFDLVRALGSKVGESEVNYLMIIPLNGEAVLFSPEYEVVHKFHQGFEVELPTQHAELEAIKLAHQSTFLDERDHKTGFQVYAEIFQHKPVVNFVMVYINAQRIGLHESVLSMFGLTGDVELDGIYNMVKKPAQTHEVGEVQPKISNAGLIFNNSIFKTLSPSLVVGLEVLFYHDIMMKNSSLAIYPQVLVRITSTLSVQLGFGLYFEPEKFIPQFAYRVINESV